MIRKFGGLYEIVRSEQPPNDFKIGDSIEPGLESLRQLLLEPTPDKEIYLQTAFHK